MNRKRPGSKSKKQAEAAESSASIAKPTLSKLETSGFDPPGSLSLQPGQVMCPVCGMPVLERDMNNHLGKMIQHCSSWFHNPWFKAAFCFCRQLPGTGDLAT